MPRSSKESTKPGNGVGIPIDPAAFREETQRYLDRIERRYEFGNADYIAMTRLWNTIDLGGMSKTDELCRRYAEAFFPHMVEDVSRALEAVPTKGMALYSKKFDLYIGGKPHANSQYSLVLAKTAHPRR